MAKNNKRPFLLVFAGPNGSGKSTVAQSFPHPETYINADDIKAEHGLSDLEAAQQAETLRKNLLSKRADFAFETVLSTERNLFLMNRAKDVGYYIFCVYVLTISSDINIARVRGRVATGGHDVPKKKIIARYYRALSLLPQVNQLCDELLLYDNSRTPVLIYSKNGTNHQISSSDLWPEEKIRALLNLQQ